MKKVRLYISALIVFVLSVSLTGCLTQVFGENVENFAEYKKNGTVEIPSEASTVIYFNKTYDDYTEAGNPGDYSKLVVKNLKDETEKIIFQGHLGHDIDYVAVNKENERLYYTLLDWRSGDSYTYLIVYDLANMQEVNKLSLIEESSANGVLTGILFDEANGKVIFNLYRMSNEDEYLSFDIETAEIKKLGSSDYYDGLFEEINVYHIDYSGKMLFDIYLYNGLYDFHNSYHKPKYAGVYVYDGVNNIRVSKNSNEIAEQFWFEDQKYVISGSYVYDTEGKMFERKIADGIIKAVY
jgi:hypothetical protein